MRHRHHPSPASWPVHHFTTQNGTNSPKMVQIRPKWYKYIYLYRFHRTHRWRSLFGDAAAVSLPHRCTRILWGLRRAPASLARDSADPRTSRSPREAPVRRQRLPVQHSRRRGAATPPTGTARHNVLVTAAQLRVRLSPRLLWPAPAALAPRLPSLDPIDRLSARCKVCSACDERL